MREKATANQNEAWYPLSVALIIADVYCSGALVRSDLAGCACLVTLVNTDMRIAVPTEVATCRIVLLTAVPWAINDSGRAFIPEVVTGIITMEIPNIRIP